MHISDYEFVTINSIIEWIVWHASKLRISKADKVINAWIWKQDLYFIALWFYAVIVDAPHVLEETIPDSEGDPAPVRTWWTNNEPVSDSGLEKSINLIKNCVARQVHYAK